MKKIFYFLLTAILLSSCQYFKTKEEEAPKKDSLAEIKTVDSLKPVIAAPEVIDYPAKIAEYLVNDYLRDNLAKIPAQKRKFVFDTINLNRDPKPEIFVALEPSYFCTKSGCPLLILNSDFTLNTSMSPVNFPIFVSAKSTSYWKDLFIPSAGKIHIMLFTNKQYPSNPLEEPGYDFTADDIKIELLKWPFKTKYDF